LTKLEIGYRELVAKLQEKENMLNSMKAELYANRDRQKQYLEVHEANEKLK
jgi:hypothetical protein